MTDMLIQFKIINKKDIASFKRVYIGITKLDVMFWTSHGVYPYMYAHQMLQW